MTVARRVAALVGVLVLALAGCTETPKVRADDPVVSVPTAVDPASAAASTPALAKQKKAAGLPDCPTSDAAVAPVAKGLPDLTLACLGGGRSTRLAGLRGTPMIINIWGQWCPECRTEAPFLAEVSRRAGSRLRVIGIDYDDQRPELAIAFAQQAGWTYPQLFDQDRAVTDALRLPAGAPQTIFVRADGGISYVSVKPYASTTALRADLNTHLGLTL